MGAAIGFAQTTLSMLKNEDWGKLDFCEYALILLKRIHVLLICLGGYILISTSLMTMVGGLAHASELLNSIKVDRYAALLLAGYGSSRFLTATLFKHSPLRWREIFIEHLREELKLRLIQLHAGLCDVPKKVLEEKAYPFYQQHQVQIASDLKSPQALSVKSKDYPLQTRYLMEWQGYRETARLLEKNDRLFSLRSFLCPLGTVMILAVLIYLLYSFSFFRL